MGFNARDSALASCNWLPPPPFRPDSVTRVTGFGPQLPAKTPRSDQMTKFLFQACPARFGSGLLLVTTDACCTVPFVGKKPYISSYFLWGPRVAGHSALAACCRMRLQGGLLVRVPFFPPSRIVAGVKRAPVSTRFGGAEDSEIVDVQ